MEENNSPRLSEERQAPRRMGMVHCDKCGEDYSATYKSCPFCEEDSKPRKRRSGARHFGGKTSGGGYRGGGVNMAQLLKVVLSLVIVLAAVYILVTKVGPIFFGDKEEKPDSKPGTSQVDPVAPKPDEDEQTEKPDQPVPDQDPNLKVNSLTVNKKEFTLDSNGSYKLKVTVDPESAAEHITYVSSDPNVLRVSDDGTVTNVNTDKKKITATVTITCGDRNETVSVFCKGGSNEAPAPKPDAKPDVKPETKPEPKPEPKPESNGTIVSGKTQGVVYNADGGLNVRSEPDTSKKNVIASFENGNSVTILAQEGEWYKVKDGAGTVGYVHSDYIKIK